MYQPIDCGLIMGLQSGPLDLLDIFSWIFGRDKYIFQPEAEHGIYICSKPQLQLNEYISGPC